MIIDAWAQHPTLRHSQDPMFDSLRRWSRQVAPTEQSPVGSTIQKMDEAGVTKALISAWVAPHNVMISNDEVADFVSEYPDRLIGISKPQLICCPSHACEQPLSAKASCRGASPSGSNNASYFNRTRASTVGTAHSEAGAAGRHN